MSNPNVESSQSNTENKGKTPPRVADPGARLTEAEAVVRHNVLWTLGAGVIPVPIVDVLAVSAVQLKMLKQLSDVYEVSFSESLVKKLVGSLLAGLGGIGLGVALGAALGGSIAKLVPALGSAIGVLSVPIVSGAFTHAVGRVFTMHFESGGTFLDFDPRTMRAYFKEEFEKAREVVTELKNAERAKADHKPS